MSKIIELIQKQIPTGDPTLDRQFLADERENLRFPEEMHDPIGDERHTPVKGLIHRYSDRALILPTWHCACSCRFCFRRERLAKMQDLTPDETTRVLDYLASHSEIHEVILSGGDPLMLPLPALTSLIQRVAEIPHIMKLRIHTRVPLVNSPLVSDDLLTVLSQCHKTIWLSLHTNSASELTPEVIATVMKLRKLGIPLLSQTVLLKGVNDSITQLTTLFEKLTTIGVHPYYLHYPDLARGTSHFRIPLQEALALVDELRGHIPGYCIPQFVIDIPGGHGKILASKAKRLEHDLWQLRSPLTDEEIQVHFPNSTKNH